MRPIRRKRGVTLVELAVALVVLAIITALILYFVYPVRQAIDVVARAELTDAADNALQRIGREVRIGLPNSVRVAGGQFVEFIPVVTGGRYRAEAGGAASGVDCPASAGLGQPASDQLSFGASDTCFKSLGPLVSAAAITVGDFVVLSNYGKDHPGQDVYEAGATNLRSITSSSVEAGRQRLEIAAGVFDATLHDSAARRFYVARGNGATLLPVTFGCTGGAVVRWSGYAMTTGQPTSRPAGAVEEILAAGVTACQFAYADTTAPQIGLLTLQLTLARTRADGGSETAGLYHSVHIANLP